MECKPKTEVLAMQKISIATNTNATVFLYAKPILDDVPTLCD